MCNGDDDDNTMIQVGGWILRSPEEQLDHIQISIFMTATSYCSIDPMCNDDDHDDDHENDIILTDTTMIQVRRRTLRLPDEQLDHIQRSIFMTK